MMKLLLQYFLFGFLWATHAIAEVQPTFYFHDGKITADIESVSTDTFLKELSAQAKIKIRVVGEISPLAKVYGESKPLIKFMKSWDVGIAAVLSEHDISQRLIAITLYSSRDEKNQNVQKYENYKRIKYIRRQIGRYDNDTVDLMTDLVVTNEANSLQEKLEVLEVLKTIEGDYAQFAIEKILHANDAVVRVAAAKALYEQAGEDKSIRLIAQKYFQAQGFERIKIANIVKSGVHPAAKFIHQDISK